MRSLVVTLLVLFSLAVFLGAIGAAGVWSLYHQQVRAEPPAVSPSAADEGATLASASPSGPAIDLIEPPRWVAKPGNRPAPAPNPIVPVIAGPIDLPALAAVTRGRMIRVEPVDGGYSVTDWRDPAASVGWDIANRAPGWYTVEISFACEPGAGGSFVVACADQTLPGKAVPTGGPEQFRTASLGSIHLPPQQTQLTLKADGPLASTLMNVRHVRLVPARE